MTGWLVTIRDREDWSYAVSALARFAESFYRESEERTVSNETSRIEDIRTRLRQLERELTQLERFGRDRFVDGDVIRFTKTFGTGTDVARSYTYAALKTPTGWCLTGQHRRWQITYDELIQYVVAHPVAENVQVAARWVDVTQAADEKKIIEDVSNRVSPSEPTENLRKYSYADEAEAKTKFLGPETER